MSKSALLGRQPGEFATRKAEHIGFAIERRRGVEGQNPVRFVAPLVFLRRRKRLRRAVDRGPGIERGKFKVRHEVGAGNLHRITSGGLLGLPGLLLKIDRKCHDTSGM